MDPMQEPAVAGFKVLGRLGGGAMGTVYRARADGADHDVALKLLSSDSVQQRRRFKREADIQGKLEHPNLVKVLAAGEDGDRNWLAMELVEGGTLESVVDRLGQLPVDFIAPALLQLAGALAFLHQNEVIHRDLKPSNVMLSDAGVLRITDFGLARRSGQTALTKQGTMMGTLAYMSPEVVSGGDVGAPNDMYALGVMAYEMATGRLPYDADNTDAWLAAIVGAKVPPPSALRPEVPRELDDLVLALLAKDPAARPTAAQACTRLAVAASTTGMPESSMPSAVRKLVEDLKKTLPEQPTWRTAVTPVAEVVESTVEAPPPPAGGAWMGVLTAAVVVVIVVWQAMQPEPRDPATEATECSRRRAALQQAQPELVRRVSGAPALTESVARWAAAKDAVERRAAASAADAAANKAVAGLSSAAFGACPARGTFAPGVDGALECDAHPAMRPSVPAEPVPAGARAAVDLATQVLLIASSPELAGCVERQRRVLDALMDKNGEVRAPAGLTLADLEREQPSLAFFLHPAGETYALAGPDNERVLECSKHLSVQRVARRTAAFPLVPARP